MRSPVAHQRLHLAIRIVAVAACASMVIWAWRPDAIEPGGFDPDRGAGSIGAPSDPAQRSAAIDPDVFDIMLWYTPPLEPKPTPVQPKKPIPLRLALLSITQERTTEHTWATVYDEQDDSVHTLRIGDEIRGYHLSQIHPDAIELIDGPRALRLALDPEGGG